jgi:hypothetical protein
MIREEPKYTRVMLVREERDFLLLRCGLSSDLKSQLERRSVGNSVEAWIDLDEAEELREELADILQTEGFDQQYRPTPHGQIIERLIDKLFTG